MIDIGMPLALAGSPSGEANPLGGIVLMGIIFAIFYFVLIMPMRTKQKKLELKWMGGGDPIEGTIDPAPSAETKKATVKR